jgi:hypothetical protein
MNPHGSRPSPVSIDSSAAQAPLSGEPQYCPLKPIKW